MQPRGAALVCFAALVASAHARAEDEAPIEVEVRGGKKAPRAEAAPTLGRAEVRQLPGAFGDPWRAIEIAPGVTPVLSGLPYFYLRGAPPGNVGYSFDGVRVPYLFHFGLGPAVVPPALIARTDVYGGGYPASLSRYAGGFVAATAMPPKETFHGEGQARLIDAGALIEAPFAGGRGSALAGGRYAYAGALFSLLQSDTSLDYRDYQARVSYALTERDTISALFFGAYDLAKQRQLTGSSVLAAAAGSTDPSKFTAGQVERVLFASEFHRADLRWDRVLSGGGQIRVAATAGFDRTRVEARRAAEDVLIGGRAVLEQPASRSVLVRMGADVTVDLYGGDPLPRYADDDDVVERQSHIFTSHSDFAAGPWVEAVIALGSGSFFQPGLRMDAFGSGSVAAVGVDPRLSGKLAVTDRLRIVHAHGLATQPPSTPVALPAITVARLQGGLQRSLQTSAGVEVDLPEDVTISAVGFRNAFFDLNDALGTARVELIDLEKSDALLDKSRGTAYGVEVGAKRKVSRRLTGLASYTASRSERTVRGRTFLSAYDRAHVLNLALSYDLGRQWRAGARWVLYSGTPVAEEEPAFPGQLVGRPPARTPLFQRVDLRVEKRFRVGEGGWVSVVAEAMNATLSREVTGYACARAFAVPGRPPPSPTCEERVVGPISVPSLGVEGGF